MRKRSNTKEPDVCSHLGCLSNAKRTKIYENVWIHANRKETITSNGFYCLTCDRVFETVADHKASHPGRKGTGHELVLDLSTLELFCTSCNDYVYSPDIDRKITSMIACKTEKQLLNSQDTKSQRHTNPSSPPSQLQNNHNDHANNTTSDAPHINNNNNNTTTTDTDTIITDDVATTTTYHFDSIPQESIFPPGLRGLNNMGQTCFMNSILQALLQSPLLRDHYLGHKHPRQTCPITMDGGHCVACELNGVFSTAYCGDRAPHSPAAFLHAWWMLAGSALGRYEQQDAHEFFLFILEMIAATTGRENIMSNTFHGMLRSDVVCSSCGATSTTEDAFSHLSLDIPPTTLLIPPPILPRPNINSINGKAGAIASKAATKQLVGAAKAAHLARLSRLQAAAAAAAAAEGTTIDTSTTNNNGGGGTAASEVTMDDSVSEMNSTHQNTITVMNPSPPPADGSTISFEQASAICTDGTAVATRDTLSSPKRDGAAAAAAANNNKKGKKGTSNKKTSTTTAAADQPPQDSPASDSPGSKTNAATTATLSPTPPPPPPQQQQPHPPPSSSASPHPALAGYFRWPGPSLHGCLKRFVWPENLGNNEQWSCSCCGAQQGAIKQLSLSRLPSVLVLHAKRFEHSGGVRATAKKLFTYLSFPLEGLDMSTYLSSNALRKRHIARRFDHNNNHNSSNTTIDGVDDNNNNIHSTTPASNTKNTTNNSSSNKKGDHSVVVKQGGRQTRSARKTAPAVDDTDMHADDTTTTTTTTNNNNATTTTTTVRKTRSQKALDDDNENHDDDSVAHRTRKGGVGRKKQTAVKHEDDDEDHENNNNSNDDDTIVAVNNSNNDNQHHQHTAAGTLYDAFAVVCHIGSFQGGHYIAYVRCEDGGWYVCDDEYVAPVSEDVVKNCQAYMLFYGQQELMPWR